LGDGVSQKGSLVDETKARFDFSHKQAMTPSECAKVESLVQQSVAEALPVHIQTVPLDKALAINNLRAVFGERYPDPVRVVSIGPTIPELLAAPDSAKWEAFSIELCGGTHLPDTSKMANFALVDESAVAKGVRRVVGVTGTLAERAIATGAELQQRFTAIESLDVASADEAAITTSRAELSELKIEIDGATISTHIKAGLREGMAAREKVLLKKLKEQQAGATDKAAAVAVEQAMAAASEGARFVVIELEEVDGKAMQPIVRQVLKQAALPVIALSKAGGKVACFAAVPDEQTDTLNAGAWLKPVLAEMGGKGGGKPAQAQGAGPDLAGYEKAIEVARAFAGDALGQ